MLARTDARDVPMSTRSADASLSGNNIVNASTANAAAAAKGRRVVSVML